MHVWAFCLHHIHTTLWLVARSPCLFFGNDQMGCKLGTWEEPLCEGLGCFAHFRFFSRAPIRWSGRANESDFFHQPPLSPMTDVCQGPSDGGLRGGGPSRSSGVCAPATSSVDHHLQALTPWRGLAGGRSCLDVVSSRLLAETPQLVDVLGQDGRLVVAANKVSTLQKTTNHSQKSWKWSRYIVETAVIVEGAHGYRWLFSRKK